MKAAATPQETPEKPAPGPLGVVVAMALLVVIVAAVLALLIQAVYGVNVFHAIDAYREAMQAQQAGTEAPATPLQAVQDAAAGIATRIRTVVVEQAQEEPEPPTTHDAKPGVEWDGKINPRSKAVPTEAPAIKQETYGKAVPTNAPLETKAAAPEPTAAKQPRGGKETP